MVQKVRIRILSVPVMFTEDDHGTGCLIAVLLLICLLNIRKQSLQRQPLSPLQLQPCVLPLDDHRPSLQQQAFKASRGTRFSWHELLAPSSLVVGIASITGRPHLRKSFGFAKFLRPPALRHQPPWTVAGANEYLDPWSFADLLQEPFGPRSFADRA